LDARLDPFGHELVLDDVTLRTPGLEGHARLIRPSAADMRAEADWSGALEEALASEGVRPQILLELSETQEVDIDAPGTRSTAHGEDALELEVPGPGEGWGQMVLHTDEAGVTTWEFARDARGERDATRGGGSRTYIIRRRVPPAEASTGSRGVVGSVGRKLLGVFVFKLLDPVIGAVGEHFAERWEEKRRPYRLRPFGVSDYATGDVEPLAADAFGPLARGRALLLVHGTFSRAHTAFGTMPRSFVEELHRLYEGRVFAFDHFTLSHDPRRNVDWMLTRLPDGSALDLDIVCHSRGGLVARTLAERGAELGAGRSPRVRRVVFVATPNAGTVLADARHIESFIDTYTNLLNFLPDNGVTEVLEGVVTVAKMLSVGVLGGMDGLRCMDPRGDFLAWLNAPSGGGMSYHALAGDFEPTSPAWREWAKNRLLDSVFDRARNDLVVPTEGVYEANGSDLFPIGPRLTYGAEDGVSHSTFFSEPRTQERILSWLGEIR
jgi:hypothetical protein